MARRTLGRAPVEPLLGHACDHHQDPGDERGDVEEDRGIGGNDVHVGKSAEQVLTDFKSFVAKVRAHFPAIPIAFSSLTPGPGRWEEAPRRKETNQLIKQYIATQPNLHFIDLWDAMLTADGQPRKDLWVADGVHPNHAGYLLRVKIMRPLLGEPDSEVK